MSLSKRFRYVCVVALVAVLLPHIAAFGQERINMKEIHALTLRKGKMTGGNKPVKQLECIAGSARGMFEPSVVQCKNQGWDGREVQWECSAEMSQDYTFGEITVTCEGWSGPGDIDVVVGSCGLEYSLELTETGRRNRGENTRFTSDYARHDRHDGYGFGASPSSANTSLYILGGLCFAGYMLYKCSTTRNDGMPNAPPPPYSAGGGNGGGAPRSGYGSSSSSRAGNNGPGFWSGMAAGGLLGVLFPRNRGSGYGSGQAFRPRRSGWGSSSGSAWGSSSSSSPGVGSSSSSGSSGSHTSRGFGGSRSR